MCTSVYISIPFRTHYAYGFIISPYTCHFMQCLLPHTLHDMALYIDDNDNNKTFVGHILYLWPSEHHLHPRSARAQMMLLGPQINNMPSKSLVIVLF